MSLCGGSGDFSLEGAQGCRRFGAPGHVCDGGEEVEVFLHRAAFARGAVAFLGGAVFLGYHVHPAGIGGFAELAAGRGGQGFEQVGLGSGDGVPVAGVFPVAGFPGFAGFLQLALQLVDILEGLFGEHRQQDAGRRRIEERVRVDRLPVVGPMELVGGIVGVAHFFQRVLEVFFAFLATAGRVEHVLRQNQGAALVHAAEHDVAFHGLPDGEDGGGFRFGLFQFLQRFF